MQFQTDGDEVGKLDSAGLPMLKKIGIIFEMFRAQCRAFFKPGEYIGFDEMMVLCMSACPFFNFLPAKPSVRKGLKFLAACFSRSGLQYTYDVQLARKQYDQVRRPGNSVNCQLLKNACNALNVHGQKNHKIVMDRGFTSLPAFLEVLQLEGSRRVVLFSQKRCKCSQERFQNFVEGGKADRAEGCVGLCMCKICEARCIHMD